MKALQAGLAVPSPGLQVVLAALSHQQTAHAADGVNMLLGMPAEQCKLPTVLPVVLSPDACKACLCVGFGLALPCHCRRRSLTAQPVKVGW